MELPHSASHQVMDVYKDFLLVNFSSLTNPNQILLGHVPGRGQERSIVLKEVGIFSCCVCVLRILINFVLHLFKENHVSGTHPHTRCILHSGAGQTSVYNKHSWRLYKLSNYEEADLA